MFQSGHLQNAAGRPVMASIGVEDIDVARSAYCEELGHTLVDEGQISKPYAEIWGGAEIDGARTITLAPGSSTPVFIRLVEVKPGGLEPAVNPGWFAIELCVQDATALYKRLSTSNYFRPFAPPAELSFTDKVFPFQCRGLNGEILYLNETRGNLPELDLPLAKSFVDHIFISVLSASDIDISTEYYANLLGLDVQERHELPYKTINRVHGLPLTTLHKLNTLGTGRHVFLEVDQSPTEARTAQPKRAFFQGICCMSFAVSGGGEDAGFVGCADVPYGGRTIKREVGPDGERIELIMI